MVFCAQNQSIRLFQSRMGRALPRSLCGEAEILVAMKAFCDGSGDRASDFLILTAVAASDYVWAGFEKNWKRLLEDRDPPAPYVHACDMMALQDDFAPAKGWDKAKVSKLLWDCFLYAQNLDKEDFCVFTCTVDMEAHRRIRQMGLRLPHPYAICSRFCPEKVLKWYMDDFAKNFARGKLNYFFDRGEKHLGAFNLRRRTAAKEARKANLDLRTYWDLVDDAIPVDSKTKYPIQLADVISWAHSRRLMRQKFGQEFSSDWSEIYKIAEGVLPFKRAEMTGARLNVLALYSGIYPEGIEDHFGPDWLR